MSQVISQVTQVINVSINAGTNYVLPLQWVNLSTNLPFDLSGYSSKLQVRASYTDPIILLEMSTANGRIILGGAQGDIDVVFVPSDTLGIAWSKAIYDLLVTSPLGVDTKLCKGEFIVEPTVTSLV